MLPVQIKLIVFCFLGSLVVAHPMTEEKTEEKPIEIIDITPRTKTYSIQIREFHECVSCNSDAQARKDYDMCLKELSDKNQEVMGSCCTPVFGNDFCKNATIGKTDYSKVCQDPNKALKVGKCFWQNIGNKESSDIQKYRECKRKILDKYCTISSLDNWN